MNKTSKKLFQEIKNIVIELDPENWADIAPSDEYDDYVYSIVRLLNQQRLGQDSLSEIFPDCDPISMINLLDALKKLNSK